MIQHGNANMISKLRGLGCANFCSFPSNSLSIHSALVIIQGFCELRTGSGLIWFPIHIWRVFTLGIMEPRAARQVAIVQDYSCLSSYAKLVQGRTSWCLAPNFGLFTSQANPPADPISPRKQQWLATWNGLGPETCWWLKLLEFFIDEIGCTFQVQATAIRNSVPEELNLTNAPNSRIYYAPCLTPWL